MLLPFVSEHLERAESLGDQCFHVAYSFVLFVLMRILTNVHSTVFVVRKPNQMLCPKETQQIVLHAVSLQWVDASNDDSTAEASRSKLVG